MKTKRQNLFKLGKVLVLVLLSAFYGCKNDKEELTPAVSGAEVPVEINLQSASFEDAGVVTPRALSANLVGSSNSQEIQIQQIKLNNNINLVAEMVPVTDTVMPQKRASTNSVTYTVPLQTRYTVLVFQSEANGGKFVKAQNYERGAEQFRDPMMLTPGAYQFVAISSNKRTGGHPSYTFTSQDSTLTHCRAAVSAVDGDDFMHEVQQKTITGNAPNTLNIQFHHDATQVTVTLDSSPLQQPITLVSGAYLETSNSILNINLKDGSYDYNGSRLNKDLLFTPALPATSVSSSVLIYPPNSIGFAPKVVIPSLAVGQDQPFTNITIEGFELKPGFRYQLKITLTATDKIGMYLGLPVARIGGRIWMRHNLGAEYSFPADNTLAPSGFPQWGDFFQWGWQIVVAHRQEDNTELYQTRPLRPSSWNSANQPNQPAKTNTDPCPDGFRVPTAQEFQGLMANTNFSTMPQLNWPEGITSQVSYLILTSKTNAAVKLTLPATGNWNQNDYIRVKPNARVALWTTTNGNNIAEAQVYNYERSFSAPVLTSVQKLTPIQTRCVVESTDKKIDL